MKDGGSGLEPSVTQPEQDSYFRTDHLQKGLAGRAARGGVITIVSQGASFLVTLSGTVILARLLTPQDYGLIGMVVVVTGFLSIFKDLGLGSATIQRPTLTFQQVSTLFWVNVVFGMAVTLVCVLIAPLMSWFYGESRLVWVTAVSGLGFAVSGLAVQHEALLRRQMRFVALSLIGVLSVLVGYAVGIYLAWKGYHYRALVISQLATVATNSVAVCVVCGWRPSIARRRSDVRSMIRFGGHLTGFSIVNYFSRNLDNLLIGKVWGATQLGLYGRAYQLMMLPIELVNNPVTSVAVPTLSRLVNNPEAYRHAYLRMLEKIALITMPASMLMIITADWIVSIVLGPKWIGVSPLLVVLGISGLLQPIANTTGWLFITQGRTDEMFKFSVIGGPIVVLSIIAGLHWGAIGVAVAYVTAKLCLADPLLYWFVGRRGPVRTQDLYKTIALVAAATVSGGLMAVGYRAWFNPTNLLSAFVVSALITLSVMSGVLLLIPAGRRALFDVKQVFDLLVRPSTKAVAGDVGS